MPSIDSMLFCMQIAGSTNGRMERSSGECLMSAFLRLHARRCYFHGTMLMAPFSPVA